MGETVSSQAFDMLGVIHTPPNLPKILANLGNMELLCFPLFNIFG